MAIFEFLDSLFAPLISYPAVFILLVTLVLTTVVTLLNVILIKKDVRNRIKNQMKYYQDEIRKASKEKNVKKMQELHRGQLDVQFQHMKETLKTLPFTLILFFFVYAWMQHLYVPQAAVGPDGIAMLMYDGIERTVKIESNDSGRLLIADDKMFKLSMEGLLVKRYHNDNVELYGQDWKVRLSTEGDLMFNMVMADLPVFGKVGLIGWYILTAITFGILFRKLFDIV